MSLKSVKTLTASQLAKKWNLSLGEVGKLIAQGAAVEKEHTKNDKEAKEVARDHLGERPDYYKKLKKIEKSPISMKEGLSTEPERDTAPIGDYTGASRKVMKVDEIKIPPKVKKIVAGTMTAANLATGASVYDNASRGVGSPIRDVASVASGLPGKIGYGAMGANWTVKGFDKAREHIRAKAKQMKEQGSPANPARYTERPMYEATFQGKKVPLNKPMRGDVKKSKVFVDPDGDGKAQKVNFGDPNMTIKKSNPERRKSFRARHNCDNPGPKTKARYWSCKAWEETQIDEISAELVGKVSNARFWRGETPSKTLTRAINKKFIESGMKKGKKETKMDTKEHINEALDNILENNLVEMKENFLAALQEKAMQKIEEKKKEIASNYFAQ